MKSGYQGGYPGAVGTVLGTRPQFSSGLRQVATACRGLLGVKLGARRGGYDGTAREQQRLGAESDFPSPRMGTTAEPPPRRGIIEGMSDDNQRQEDATTADLSRQGATSDASEYALSIE